MEAVAESPSENPIDSKAQSQSVSQHSLFDCEDSWSGTIHQLISSNRPLFVVQHNPHHPHNCHLQQEIIKQKILTYNRKEKSLEELSRKFIQTFEGDGETLMELDKVTVQLKVERRRIYDIVNIFESLQVVRKTAKKNYLWRGLKEAVKTITAIIQSDQPLTPSTKKQKSLEQLAARFLKLFIASPNPLSLEEAAKVLIQTEDKDLVKTKIRRLYDIVNVFKSVGLVQKDHLPNKKPGFRWLGTGQLERLIEERRKKCWREGEERMEGGLQKMSRGEMERLGNVNDWFSDEERKVFVTLGWMKEFSQKVFFPEIIRKENSISTFGGSQECLNDIYAQD